MAFVACSDDTIEEMVEVEITEVSDLTLRKGQAMIINGSNFSPVKEENIVMFGAVQAEVTKASVSEIETIVPNDATSGTITITANNQTVTVGEFGLMPTIETVLVEGGTYDKGCYEHVTSETVESFNIGVYEVTNEEYAAFLNDYVNENDDVLVYDDLIYGLTFDGNEWIVVDNKEQFPVVRVTQDGANKYAEWYGGRLPTDNEWMFAAIGGNQTNGYLYAGSDSPSVGWFSNNATSTNEVGLLLPNELDLYDMSGNAAEWVSGADITLRGGDWASYHSDDTLPCGSGITGFEITHTVRHGLRIVTDIE